MMPDPFVVDAIALSAAKIVFRSLLLKRCIEVLRARIVTLEGTADAREQFGILQSWLTDLRNHIIARYGDMPDDLCVTLPQAQYAVLLAHPDSWVWTYGMVFQGAAQDHIVWHTAAPDVLVL